MAAKQISNGRGTSISDGIKKSDLLRRIEDLEFELAMLKAARSATHYHFHPKPIQSYPVYPYVTWNSWNSTAVK